jgi:hypothetical protein
LGYSVLSGTNENFRTKTGIDPQISYTNHIFFLCNETSLILINLERNLIEIRKILNYKSAAENMFNEVIKWNSHAF